MYDFCKSVGFQYLPFRFWTGMWVGVIMMALVAFDASAFVCYITRFTEENFACLIALIFIKKAIDKVLHIADYYPIFESDCFCQPTNDTLFGQGSVQYSCFSSQFAFQCCNLPQHLEKCTVWVGRL